MILFVWLFLLLFLFFAGMNCYLMIFDQFSQIFSIVVKDISPNLSAIISPFHNTDSEIMKKNHILHVHVQSFLHISFYRLL